MSELSLVGTQLGKYQIRSEIGKGGMGTVYLGYDADLDRQVAVKVLAKHLAWDSEFVERFLQEARTAARLGHANIVTIYDVGQQGDLFYFVMEYVPGETVAGRVRRLGALPFSEVLHILRSLAQALDYAHSQGVIHRDVKPGNIMIRPDGSVKLMDFGIARAAQAGRLTNTGMLLGTPQYMSPERLRGEQVDARADQYGLGVVAYQMLTGHLPFDSDDPSALMYQVVHEAPPPAAQYRRDLPDGVGRALERALAKSPGGRYPTTTAFVDALAQPGRGGRSGGAVATPGKGNWRSLRWLLPGLGLVVTLAVVLASTLGEDDAPKKTLQDTYVTQTAQLVAMAASQSSATPSSTLVLTRAATATAQHVWTPTATHLPDPTGTATSTASPTEKPTVPSTPTPTATAAYTPEPTNTSAPSPTATSTATATNTLTSIPTATRTPAPATFTPVASGLLPAPVSLEPKDQDMIAADKIVQFRWTWNGMLAGDQYFVITIAFPHDGATWYDVHWLKDMSVTAPDYLTGLITGDRVCTWNVTIMRQTGTDRNGAPAGVPVSQASANRTFTWQAAGTGGEPGPPPTWTPRP